MFFLSLQAFVAMGDYNGHVGLGVKCSKEVATAIRGAIILAKLSIIPVRMGYWGNKIGTPHTVPCKVRKKRIYIFLTAKCHVFFATLVQNDHLSPSPLSLPPLSPSPLPSLPPLSPSPLSLPFLSYVRLLVSVVVFLCDSYLLLVVLVSSVLLSPRNYYKWQACLIAILLQEGAQEPLATLVSVLIHICSPS